MIVKPPLSTRMRAAPLTCSLSSPSILNLSIRCKSAMVISPNPAPANGACAPKTALPPGRLNQDYWAPAFAVQYPLSLTGGSSAEKSQFFRDSHDGKRKRHSKTSPLLGFVAARCWASRNPRLYPVLPNCGCSAQRSFSPCPNVWEKPVQSCRANPLFQVRMSFKSSYPEIKRAVLSEFMVHPVLDTNETHSYSIENA